MCHVRKPLAIAVGLNAAIFVAETSAGFAGHSNSLIMDGVHNFSDELALACLYLAYSWPVKMSVNLQRLANLLNSIGLIAISGFLVWHSIERVVSPQHTNGYIPLITGLFAAATNWYVARLLYPIKEQNTAIRLAYLHNLGDTFVSLAPVIAGLLVLLSGESYFDTAIAITIGIWLIWSTIKEVTKSYDSLIWPDNAVCKHENLGLEMP